MNYGAKKFRKTAIETAAPEKILLMLYEGAIKSCKLAKKALQEGDIQSKCNHISKAHDIIMELNNTLDHKQSEEVAQQLESLYNFCVTQLLEANLNNSEKSLDSVIQVMTTLYEGWVTAVKDLRQAKGAQQQEGEVSE